MEKLSTGFDEEFSVELTPRELRDAIRAVTERCPEYAPQLTRLSESGWAMKLYADAYTALKERYQTLAADYLRLQHEHADTRVRAAVTGDFLAYISRRLEKAVDALDGAVYALEESASEADAHRSQEAREACRSELAANVVALAHIATDLAQAVEAMRPEGRPAEPQSYHLKVTGRPAEMEVPIGFENFDVATKNP